MADFISLIKKNEFWFALLLIVETAITVLGIKHVNSEVMAILVINVFLFFITVPLALGYTSLKGALWLFTLIDLGQYYILAYILGGIFALLVATLYAFLLQKIRQNTYELAVIMLVVTLVIAALSAMGLANFILQAPTIFK